MGFGRHRVYKNYDPRAKVMRQTCYEVLDELGMNHGPLLKLAMETGAVSRCKDDYFVSKKLSAIRMSTSARYILRAMGFPTAMFTVLFAVARTVGWISQWNEMIEDATQKIGRPRQMASGQTERPYKPSTCAAREYCDALLARLAPDGCLGDCPEAPADAARGAAWPRSQRQYAPAKPAPAGRRGIGSPSRRSP